MGGYSWWKPVDVSRRNFGVKFARTLVGGYAWVEAGWMSLPLSCCFFSLFLLQGPKLPLPQGDARDQNAGILLELNQAVVSAEDTRLASFPKPIKVFFQNDFVVLFVRGCHGIIFPIPSLYLGPNAWGGSL